MEVVSSNTDAEIARKEKLSDVESALRELAANLMRVARGAGKPGLIGLEADALIDALQAYRDVAGYWPSPNLLANAIRVWDHLEDAGRYPDHVRDRHEADNIIVNGALQVVASRLLGQQTQVRRGESEMYDGVRHLADARTKARKAHGL